MKDLAKILARNRVAPRRRIKRTQEGDITENETQPSTESTWPPIMPKARPKGKAGEIPDAWDPMYRPEIEEESRKARKPTEESDDDIEPDYVKRHRIATKKRRSSTLSIAVSPEEEAILRSYAAKLDMSFSAWARQLLFKAMGKKVPSRKK